MLKLQTEVAIPMPLFKIGSNNKILVIGSCFAQHLIEQLSYAFSENNSNNSECEWSQKQLYDNPNGVVYNPLSIARTVEILLSGEKFSTDDLVEWQNLWHSMDFHGSFSRPTSQGVLDLINRQAVQNIDTVVLTLGTSYVYFKEGQVVANCHRIPEKEFMRRRISVQETTQALEFIASLMPQANFVVTVSPIRHLRDGLAANSLSKATLRLAAEEFCQHDLSRRYYFPSYEIVMDELRDYRFTEADMCHPTLQTRDYIWSKFSEALLDKELNNKIVAGKRLARQNAHRPIVY